MSAPPLRNSLEGGTSGTTLTQAVGGNTGGASGNFFDTVTIGASTFLTFDNAQHHSGALSMKVVNAATAASTRVAWTALGAFTTDVWFRFYLFLPALPGTGQPVLCGIRSSAAAALVAELSITTAGLIRINTAGGTVAGLNGAVAVGTNKWVRIEIRCRTTAATTTGELDWWLYNTADATNITASDETKSATGLNLATNVDEVRFGQVTNPIASYTTYFDDMAVSTTGKIGPQIPFPKPAVILNAVNRAANW
jgi:hypothetical protein